MKEYNIVITETLRTVVHIEAASAEEAKKQAHNNWKKGEYVLDSADFIGVDISAEGQPRAHRTGDKGKGNPGHER